MVFPPLICLYFPGCCSDYLLGVSTCRFTNFDLNADFIQDISFQHLITILIELSGEPADDTLRDAVTQAGYEVVEIR